MSELRPGGPGDFATTRWSLVLSLDDETAAADALSTLCETYWYPLYAHLRRKNDPERAQDLTQGFLLQVLERRFFQDADRDRGRLRSFLLKSLEHYAGREWEKERAQKRGGDQRLKSMNFEWGEARYQREPQHELTPERLFDRQWALQLLGSVLDGLRASHAERGRGALFDALAGILTGGAPSRSYAQIGQELGLGEGAVKVAAHRLRTEYRKLLRRAVAATLEDPALVGEELGYLLEALG